MKLKKIVLIGLIFCLGCSSEKQSVSSASEKEVTVSISKAGFSETEAENVFNMAVRNHCRLLGQVCTVGKVVMQQDNIYGVYTYEQQGQTMTVSGTLENVKVAKSDSSIVTIGKKYFSTGIVKENPQMNDNSSQDEELESGLPHFDLPEEVDESQNGEVVLDDGTYKIRLMHIASGNMNFSGSFEGTGYFSMYVMTTDQSGVQQFVTLDGSGTYNETINVDQGWYYIVIERNNGTFTMNWQG